MSDLIDREAVQREIQNSFNAGAFRWQDGQDLMDRINALPAATRWVRCEDELPKPGQVCLVYDEDGYMSVATYTGDKYFPTAYGFHVNGEEVTDITHWMPIEPPKEEA